VGKGGGGREEREREEGTKAGRGICVKGLGMNAPEYITRIVEWF